MYHRRAADTKFSTLLPVDAENYMLKGINRPAPKAETASPIASANMATASKKIRGTDVFWGWGSSEDGVEPCARIISFHSLLCSCEMSCCCNCGSLCSPDCHTCFHYSCLRFFPDYPCQKDNDVLPPVTLDYDKVSLFSNSFYNLILNFLYISVYIYLN